MNALRATRLPRRLGRFAEPAPVAAAERPFRVLILAAAGACALVGLVLTAAEVPPHALAADDFARRVTLEFDAVQVPRPAPEPEPQPVPAPPPVLQPETVLAQAVARPAPEPADPPAVPAPAAAAPAPRRVYGVRRVYARGLGGSGGASGRLVVKRGNTVDGRPDTLTATPADLGGDLASLSSVDRAPEPLRRVRPEYSQALRDARASGTVSAYLLVDVAGNVRDVNITEDIGYDSMEVATRAFRKFRFRPAEQDGRPVAVWILHRIRFEFQE